MGVFISSQLVGLSLAVKHIVYIHALILYGIRRALNIWYLNPDFRNMDLILYENMARWCSFTRGMDLILVIWCGDLILAWFTGVLWHDDVIKWKHFPRYWPFVRGIRQSPVNSPHKGQWRGALMFSLICLWTNGWVKNRDVGDLRCHHAHYHVTVMDLFRIRSFPAFALSTFIVFIARFSLCIFFPLLQLHGQHKYTGYPVYRFSL